MQNSTSTQKPPQKHHFVRTFFASILGFIACSLLLLSLLAVWLDRTLTNTDQFISTVGPLASEPDVQNFIVEKLSTALFDNEEIPINDIARELLPAEQIAGQDVEQLRELVEPMFRSELRATISSPTFAQLWESSTKTIHSQVVNGLDSTADTVKLDFRPVITGVLNELGNTKFKFLKEKIELKDDHGVVELQGDRLAEAREAYKLFNTATPAIVAAAIFAAILACLISVHHIKTLRRIALSVGVTSALMAVTLTASRTVKIADANPVDQQMAAAVLNAITSDLRLILIVVAVTGIGWSIGSKVYSLVRRQKQ